MLLTLPPLDAIRGFVAVARRMSITLASGFGNSDYAYWLIDESPSPRSEVQEFRNWIIKDVQPGGDELEQMAIVHRNANPS